MTWTQPSAEWSAGTGEDVWRASADVCEVGRGSDVRGVLDAT